MREHIFFTGFMASGKSRTGRAMAERLGRPLVDTDAVIVERAGKSISEIFEQDGEAKFREMEAAVIAEIANDKNPQVVSLGGGALNREDNIKIIRDSGTLIRLWAKPEILSERIGRKNTRPLLANLSDEERLEKIKVMLKEREKNYAHADFSVESTNLEQPRAGRVPEQRRTLPHLYRRKHRARFLGAARGSAPFAYT